jgi:hypothetical protein
MSYHTAERPAFIEMIRADVRKDGDYRRKNGLDSVPDPEPAKNLFEIHTANKWLEMEKNTPMPKMLFGEFWYEDELCIMFADTNVGKSILAVQIGNSLARHQPIGPFGVEADSKKVLYMDFEMSGKQFQSRYSHNGLQFEFDRNFFRAGFNPEAQMSYQFKTYDDYMNSAIAYAVKKTGAQVLIIDNITCLRQGTERTDVALSLMKHLKALKTKYNLSVLVLAHTPKRNPCKPISRNDLQGSKMLINFADSAFAIGESAHDNTLRYTKQVKQRGGKQWYGSSNVCLWRLSKPINFIGYDFVDYGHEADHLRSYTQLERQAVTEKITKLFAEGLSQRQISKQLNVGLGTVNRVVNG